MLLGGGGVQIIYRNSIFSTGKIIFQVMKHEKKYLTAKKVFFTARINCRLTYLNLNYKTTNIKSSVIASAIDAFKIISKKSKP